MGNAGKAQDGGSQGVVEGGLTGFLLQGGVPGSRALRGEAFAFSQPDNVGEMFRPVRAFKGGDGPAC